MGLRSGHSAEGESPPALGSPVARTATAAQRDGAHPPAVPRGERPLRRRGPAGGGTAAAPSPDHQRSLHACVCRDTGNPPEALAVLQNWESFKQWAELTQSGLQQESVPKFETSFI